MDKLDQALGAFFAATEVPAQDEAFVWRAIEAYEKRTRVAALARTGFRAAAAAITAMAVLAVLASLEPAAQGAVAEGLRAIVFVGSLGTAIAYATRSLSGGPLAGFRPARVQA